MNIPDLPEDIYRLIAENIDDPETFRNFIRTNWMCHRSGGDVIPKKRKAFFHEEMSRVGKIEYVYRKTSIYRENPHTLYRRIRYGMVVEQGVLYWTPFGRPIRFAPNGEKVGLQTSCRKSASLPSRGW